MDFYTAMWLSAGIIIGIPIGWGACALRTRKYLKRHMHEHPEYKMYLETLQGKED